MKTPARKHVPRKQAIQRCLHYGYTGEREPATALYRQKSLSFAQYFDAFVQGVSAKTGGSPCPCAECESEVVKLVALSDDVHCIMSTPR